MSDPLLAVPEISGQRQAQRLNAIPAVYKTQYGRLAMELALKIDDPAAIFARHGYDQDGALALLETAEFTALLVNAEKEVKESGLSFRTKARAMAEDLLTHGYEIATDDLASASVRADLIQWFARIGGLEPPKADGKDSGNGGGINLTLNFAGAPPQHVVGSETLTIQGN